MPSRQIGTGPDLSKINTQKQQADSRADHESRLVSVESGFGSLADSLLDLRNSTREAFRLMEQKTDENFKTVWTGIADIRRDVQVLIESVKKDAEKVAEQVQQRDRVNWGLIVAVGVLIVSTVGSVWAGMAIYVDTAVGNTRKQVEIQLTADKEISRLTADMSELKSKLFFSERLKEMEGKVMTNAK